MITLVSHGKIIFVVGNSRSGTSMMGRILSAHESILTFNEIHFFEQLWDPTDPCQELSEKEALNLVGRLLSIYRDGYYNERDPKFYRDDAYDIIHELDAPLEPPNLYFSFIQHEVNRAGKDFGCDKTPRNIYYISEILRLFPGAKVILMLRDPRGVLLSQKYKWRRRKLGATGIPFKQIIRFWVNYHPITISFLWNSAVRAALKYDNDPRVRIVQYEHLLADSENVIRGICDLVGVDFHADMFEIPRVGSSIRKDSSDSGIDPVAANSWKDQIENNRTDLYISQRITEKNMVAFDYQVLRFNPNILSVLLSIIMWPLKTALAFILNFSRVKNLSTTLKRRFNGSVR